MRATADRNHNVELAVAPMNPARRPDLRWWHPDGNAWMLLWLLMPLLAACGKLATPALLPPQTFNFAPQAISFAPPPAPWAAEREQSGGIVGVRYVKVGSVGEGIGVGDYYDVSGRLREPQLTALLAVDSDPNDFPYSKALRNAWPRTETPYSDLESAVAERVNDALQRAEIARRARDFDAMRMEVAAALADAQLLHFTLKEVIDRAIFKPEQSANAARYKTLGRRDILVAGEPAVVLDLTLDLPEGKRYLRKVYVLHNDHLFIAEFIGLEESLPGHARGSGATCLCQRQPSRSGSAHADHHRRRRGGGGEGVGSPFAQRAGVPAVHRGRRPSVHDDARIGWS